jgi:hypothetical protein
MTLIGKVNPGVELCKPFGILVEPWGEGVRIAVIAGIADIARDRKSQTLEPHWESNSTLSLCSFQGQTTARETISHGVELIPYRSI